MEKEVKAPKTEKQQQTPPPPIKYRTRQELCFSALKLNMGQWVLAKQPDFKWK